MMGSFSKEKFPLPSLVNECRFSLSLTRLQKYFEPLYPFIRNGFIERNGLPAGLYFLRIESNPTLVKKVLFE
jgi:hypothetical protein